MITGTTKRNSIFFIKSLLVYESIAFVLPVPVEYLLARACLASEDDIPSARQNLLQTFQECGMSLVLRTNSCASKPSQIRPIRNRMIKIRRINPIPPLG